MKRGIVRVYLLPEQNPAIVRKYEETGITHVFIDYALDEYFPVRLHIPDFCMEINITPSGVEISHRDPDLLAQE